MTKKNIHINISIWLGSIYRKTRFFYTLFQKTLMFIKIFILYNFKWLENNIYFGKQL